MLAATLLSMVPGRDADMERALRNAGLVVLSRRFRTMKGWCDTENVSRPAEERRTRAESNLADAATECVICMVRKRDALLRPCGHLVLCALCANTITTCPMCRAPIDSRVRVFMS
jgi:hypothetical protein